MKEGDTITCKHYLRCRHYCAVTDSCDYILNTGTRRPQPARRCSGYPVKNQRLSVCLVLPGSYIFDRQSGQYRGYICG